MTVVAVMPCHAEPPDVALVAAVRAVLGRVVLVDDGMPAAGAAALEAIGARLGAAVVALPRHQGKGWALAAGIREARERHGATAVMCLDADGQHPPAAIPAFLATDADLVIGDRFAAGGEGMPPARYAANRLSSALVAGRLGRPVPDSQCGMRLLRRRALEEVPFPGGGMEAETRHLIRCARAGLSIAWVPIPAIYAGEISAFRPVRDSVAVITALAR